MALQKQGEWILDIVEQWPLRLIVMDVIFGLELDGYRSTQPENRLDFVRCGPLGLIGVLETRLGLTSKPVAAACRIVQYKALLEEQAARCAPFYKTSLTKDPFAVAETLLQWRDNLIEAGWNGSAPAEASARLKDLEKVEESVEGTLSSGTADRLRRILHELDRRPALINSLAVVDPRDDFPMLWRSVLDKLDSEFTDPPIGAAYLALASTDSDLGRVQRALQSPNRTDRLKLNQDGTLHCLRAHSEFTLALGVAQRLNEARRQGSSVTLIADSQRTALLRLAIEALDEPCPGFAPRSVARPIPQTLLLAFQLHWDPVDPNALLEFLTHPVCPINGTLRRRLANALVDAPGIGGPAWIQAIEDARQSVTKRHADDARALRKALERIETDLRDWVLVQRWDPAVGIPVDALIACCNRMASWAGARAEVAGEPNSHQFAALAGLSSDMATLVRPLERISRVHLERLLFQVDSTGFSAATTEAQLGHVHWVDSPESLSEPADFIIWWNCTEPTRPAKHPWNQEELEQLAAEGVRFPAPDAVAKRRSTAALNPLFAARKCLVLVWPQQRGGEATSAHPAHARIRSLLTPETDLETDDLDESMTRISSEDARLRTLDHRPLQPLRRWWHTEDPKLLAPRSDESYSSVEKFIYSPYAWVLTYKARLRAGSVTSVRLQDDNRQKGLLLHRMLDLLLLAPSKEIRWQKANREEIGQWIAARWQSLLEEEACNLLMPGRRADAARLMYEAQRTLVELFDQLRAAKVSRATSNVTPSSAPFFSGRIGGAIDLLVERADGSVAIVDLKYGGRALREKELQQQRQLQLAVYGHLVNSQHGHWPEASFYVLKNRLMLTQHAGLFPNARIVSTTESPSGLAACWRTFETVWRWRRAQLDQGWIEVTVDDPDSMQPTAAAPDSVSPAAHWQTDEHHWQFNEFDALTGWRSDA